MIKYNGNPTDPELNSRISAIIRDITKDEQWSKRVSGRIAQLEDHEPSQ